MGYNTITFTMDRKRKTLESGAFKIIYSLVIFGLAQAALANKIVEVSLPVLAVAIHEGWVILQRKRELGGKPKYVSSEEGIMVLEVLPESPAAEMGIRSGDMLLAINDSKIEDEKMLTETLSQYPNFIWFSLKRENGRQEQVSYDKMFRGKQLGLLLVPKGMPDDTMVIKFDDSILSKAMNKIKNRENDK